MDSKQFVEAVREKADAAKEAAKAILDAATPEERKALEAKITEKAKAAVKQEERDTALAALITLAKAVASDDKGLMEACSLLEKKARAERGSVAPRLPSAPRTNRFAVLDTMFQTIGASVHENTLFADYKMGRKDVYWLIADAIKLAKVPADRKWISFNPDTCEYTYESQGAEPPVGWTGYVPKALKAAVAEPVAATPTSAEPSSEPAVAEEPLF